MMHGRRTARVIPVLAWALAAAAVVQLGMWTATNWYRIFGPFLIVRLEVVDSVISGVAPFLLAAVVLVAASRGRAGRRWWYLGAGLFALHGVTQSASAAWWAWNAADPVPPEGAAQVALIAASLTSAAAAALAPVCLAVGLVSWHPVRRVTAVGALVPLAVGTCAVAGSIGLLGRELAAASDLPQAGPALIALGVAHRLLAMLGAVGMVGLAIAALRAMPAARVAPGVIIAAGATLAAAGSAASWVGQSLLSFEAQGEHLLWVFTLPWTASAAGMVLLIAGFGVTALMPARPSA